MWISAFPDCLIVAIGLSDITKIKNIFFIIFDVYLNISTKQPSRFRMFTAVVF